MNILQRKTRDKEMRLCDVSFACTDHDEVVVGSKVRESLSQELLVLGFVLVQYRVPVVVNKLI